MLAQQERRQERRTEVRTEQRTRTTTEVNRISAVVGGSVRLSAGASIGKIEDIVISDQGCIEYVIVSYHDRFVPIPWSVATVRFEDRVVLLDIDQARFDEIPTFARNEFNVLANVEFTNKVHKTFNVESSRRESRTRDGSDRRRGDGDADRKGDSRPRNKDGEADRKGERPAPKSKDADVKKEESRKDGSKKDDSKTESGKDSEKKDRPNEPNKNESKEKDSNKDKDKDKDPEKKDKDGAKS